MGGPQSGLIIGKQKLIRVLSSHPLARAVRIDKSSIAALSATLLHYIKGEALEKIPVWQMISTKLDELKIRADRWADLDRNRIGVIKGQSTIGGGSLPGEILPSWLISIDTSMAKGGAELLLTRLRQSDPPIIARIDNEQVILDPRTVSPSDDEKIFDTLNTLLKKKNKNDTY
jgi:L-seryl-tRNA(Ser) seleniumtransferase